jgi:hypothetical protein
VEPLNLTLAAWKEMMEIDKIIVAVFLDIKRAFETIDRDLWLWKNWSSMVLKVQNLNGLEAI